MTELTEQELKEALNKLTGWEVHENVLLTAFDFDDFEEAMHFANHVAQIAEEHQHHPRIIIDYTTVQIETQTHDKGHVLTQKDLDLAHAIDLLEANHEHFH